MSYTNTLFIDRGPIGSRPAANACPFRHYGWFATDTFVLSVSDGSVWTDIGPGGGGGAVASVFGRTGAVVATAADYDTSLVPDSTNKRYVTDAELAVLAATSGVNTGDQDLSGLQPLDSDLTAIAALSTTSFGRALLALADAAALRTAAGLGTAATSNTGDFDAAGAAAAAQAASQPLDSDLTAIAALSTTTFGRSLLALADAAAGRTALALGTLATQSGTFSGTSSGTNTGDQTSVSGNAGTATALQTARAIDGQSFDGTAAITVVAPGTHAATSKATPVDADELPLVDSAASFVLKKLTWANLKATLKAYTDTLYTAVGASAPPNGSAGGDLTGTYPNPTLAAAGPGATGPIGSATVAPVVTIDAKGRVTGLTSATIGIDNLTRSARSSNTILAAADKGTLIAATAAYTQTFTAAATLGAGWWCIVKNDTADGTTVLTLDPNASETIDGLTTFTMYSGETRLVQCDGSNFTSQLVEGGYAKFTPTGGNFIVPAGITKVEVVCVGGGGQGGGGASSVNTAKSGGGGGGGGAVTRTVLRPGDVGAAGATVTVTVGAGGSALGGGGAAGAGAPGSDGSDGAQTTFGTLLKAGGGGGGKGGTNANVQGGGGGSVVASAVNVTAGAPSSSTATGGAASTSPGAGSNGTNSEWGGASGGGGVTVNSRVGGSSIFGGPAGGSGGSVSAGNAGAPGGAAGATQSYTTGAGAATDTAGTFTGPFCGGGGGGGSGGSAAQGSPGRAGSIGAGGGGGGASSSATSSAVGGAGGAGGAGECRVWYS